MSLLFSIGLLGEVDYQMIPPLLPLLAKDFGVLPAAAGRAVPVYSLASAVFSLVFGYLSDHCPTALGPGPDGLGERHQAALELVAGCDAVFHDAQYTDEELPARALFGHASVGYAVGLAQEANVRRLYLFHHDPPRTDDQIDALVAHYADAALPVEAAAEGMVIDLG